jgi:hypothetical protein
MIRKIFLCIVLIGLTKAEQKKGGNEAVNQEDWIQESRANFNPKSWDNVSDIETMEEMLEIVSSSAEVLCFFYNTNDDATFTYSPFFTSSVTLMKPKNKSMKMITFDINKNPAIARYYAFNQDFSTILYFYKGSAHPININKLNSYKQSIDSWMSDIKTKAFKIKRLNSLEFANTLDDGEKQIILITSEDKKELMGMFESMSSLFPEFEFIVIVRNEITLSLEKRLNEDFEFAESEANRLVILKHDEEEYVSYDLGYESFAEMNYLVNFKRFSRVRVLNDDSFNMVFNDRKPTLFLFMKNKGRVLGSLRKAIDDHLDLNVLYSDLSLSGAEYIVMQTLSILGVDPVEAPVLVYFPFKPQVDGIIPKTKTRKLSLKGIKEFITKNINSELESYQKSENIPENAIRKNLYSHLTANNFKKTVLDNNKHFFVGLDMFQSNVPDKISDLFTKLTKVISKLELEEKIEVGICDIFKNEMGNLVQMTKYPTYSLFIKGEKVEQIDYDGEMEYMSVLRWMEKHIDIPLADFRKQLADKAKEEGNTKYSGEQDL